MATYCTDAQIKARVAAGLHVAVAALAGEWDTIVAEANRDAAKEIKRVLILKGYTPAQVAASDDAEQWNVRLGAFFAFVDGTQLANYSLESVEHLDCREELREAAALVIDDAAVAPTAGESDVGGTNYGSVSAVADETCKYRRRFK